MAAPQGNRYWQLRTKDGRDMIYENPDILWNECVDYFEWVAVNPLKEEKVFHAAGVITKTEVAKMRAMTVSALCLFLGISRMTWDDYKKRKDFIYITTRAEEIIRSQKFEGASADLLNPNIIARDLGLTDRSDVTSKGERITPVIEVNNDRTKANLEKLMND